MKVRYLLTLIIALILLPASGFAEEGELEQKDVHIPIPNFDATFDGGPNEQIIIFSGELVGFEHFPFSCPPDHICLDGKFGARFQISEIYRGDYPKSTIDFHSYSHYGIPRFTQFDDVVVYVWYSEGQLVHDKYQFDVLSPVSDGTLAYCGDPYAKYDDCRIDEFGRTKLKSFDFWPAIEVRFDDLLPAKNYQPYEYEKFQDRIRDNFRDRIRYLTPPEWEYRNGMATCKMGVTPEELAEIRYRYEYSPEAQAWLEANDYY